MAAPVLHNRQHCVQVWVRLHAVCHMNVCRSDRVTSLCAAGGLESANPAIETRGLPNMHDDDVRSNALFCTHQLVFASPTYGTCPVFNDDAFVR